MLALRPETASATAPRDSPPFGTYLLEQATVPLSGVRFGTNGTLFAAGYDGSLRVWIVEPSEDEAAASSPTRALYTSLMTNIPVNTTFEPLLDMDIDGGSDRAVLAGSDGTVKLVDVRSERRLETCTGHASYVNGVRFASRAHANTAFSTSDDGTVRLWDFRGEFASTPSATIELGGRGGGLREGLCVACDPEEEHLVYTGALDGKVRAFDIRNLDAGPALALGGHTDAVTGLAVKEGRELVSLSLDGTLGVWDAAPFSAHERTHGTRRLGSLANGGEVLKAHGSRRRSKGDEDADLALIRCCYDVSGARIACGSNSSAGNTVGIFDARRYSRLSALPGHTKPVLDVCLHPELPLVASCGMDGRLIVGGL